MENTTHTPETPEPRESDPELAAYFDAEPSTDEEWDALDRRYGIKYDD